MQALFGTAVQDYYLDLVRENFNKRKARLEQVRTREDALRYINEVKSKISKLFPLPEEKTPLDAHETGVLDLGYCLMHKIIFYSRPNYPVTGNLYLPKTNGKVPAVLFLCGHSGNGKAFEVYQIAQRALVQHGFAVFAIDPVCQGERLQYLDYPNYKYSSNMCHRHNIWGRQLLLSGDTLGVWRVWDAIRALDYLLDRPEVDSTRVGVTGVSGGGTIATFMNALENRLTMAAPGCYITTWLHNVENELPADSEQMPPGTFAAGLEMGDFLIARAPRPLLIAGMSNDFFDPRGTKETYEEVRRVYQLLDAESSIQLSIGNGDHEFTSEVRTAVCDMFSKVAGTSTLTISDDIPAASPESEILCAPAGQVKNIPGNRYIHEFAAEQATKLTTARPQHSQKELCEIMRTMLKLDTPFTPHYRVLRERRQADNMVFSRFGLETELPNRLMCVLKLKNKNNAFYHIPRAERIILYIPHLDSQDELSLMTFPEDAMVYGLDIRGIGECTPSGCDQTPKRDFFAEYEFDYHYASLGLMFGKPYLSGKVKDILCAVELLSKDGAKIELHANGQGSIPATIAALLSDKIEKLKLINPVESWESMTKEINPPYPLSVLIPGVLIQTDLPEIRAAISDKLC